MNVQVNSHDLLRMLAMIPVAPNQMDAMDFTAFVALAGAASASVTETAITISMIRVTDQSVFQSKDNGYTPAKIGKVQTIKSIREVIGLSLKEAKDLSDGVWTTVNMNVLQFKQLKDATPGVSYETK